VLSLGVALVLGALSFVLLFVADYNMAGNGSPEPRARAAWAWEYGDHLHYAGHLVAGRVLDLCPCSRNAAGAQYYYAKFHAITSRQKAVVVNSKPSSPSEWAGYITGPFMVWLDWAGDGMAWLGGQRPSTHIMVRLDQYIVAPDEVRIARGTTVTWRNVDSVGDAHTVTASPGQVVGFGSDWLVPGEQFEFTFTERGRFVYYCREHGEADSSMPIGMAGTIIVD
jgi:plastocyanin